MKFDCLEKCNKINKLIGMAIFLVLLGSCSMADTLLEYITLEEAQRLVTFTICFPTYLPPDVDPNPEIVYASDWGNPPEETYIRLMYKRIGNKAKILEVYQVYTPDIGLKTEYPEPGVNRNKAKIIMLDWMVKNLSSKKVEKLRTQLQFEDSVYITDHIVWWLYEIVEPSEYRSTMSNWVKEHVEYRILSYLPADELKKVTLSMFECSISE